MFTSHKSEWKFGSDSCCLWHSTFLLCIKVYWWLTFFQFSIQKRIHFPVFSKIQLKELFIFQFSTQFNSKIYSFSGFSQIQLKKYSFNSLFTKFNSKSYSFNNFPTKFNSKRLSWIQVLNCQNCNQCLKCQKCLCNCQNGKKKLKKFDAKIV